MSVLVLGIPFVATALCDAYYHVIQISQSGERAFQNNTRVDCLYSLMEQRCNKDDLDTWLFLIRDDIGDDDIQITRDRVSN